MANVKWIEKSGWIFATWK